MSFLLSSDGKRIYIAPIFPRNAMALCRGMHMLQCCSYARCTRAFLRKCRNYAAFGRRPPRKLQLRASFQRAVGRRGGLPRICRSCAETAKFFFLFLWEWGRSAPGVRSTDGKFFFHPCVVKGVPESMKSRYVAILLRQIKGDSSVAKVSRW